MKIKHTALCEGGRHPSLTWPEPSRSTKVSSPLSSGSRLRLAGGPYLLREETLFVHPNVLKKPYVIVKSFSRRCPDVNAVFAFNYAPARHTPPRIQFGLSTSAFSAEMRRSPRKRQLPAQLSVLFHLTRIPPRFQCSNPKFMAAPPA